MLLTTEALTAADTGSRAIFSIPQFLKEQYQAYFGGATYSPFDPDQVREVASRMLNFAAERFLYHGYYPFILTVLPDFPDFGLIPFSPLDTALTTAYSEGFLHANFTELLWLIQNWLQIPLDYTDSPLLCLLQTVYDWSHAHADQFRDAHEEVFTRYMQASPASPIYAFTCVCAELDLPIERWVAREPAEFRAAFGTDFPVSTGLTLAQVIREDVAVLPRLAQPDENEEKTEVQVSAAAAALALPEEEEKEENPVRVVTPVAPASTTTLATPRRAASTRRMPVSQNEVA